MLTLLLAFFVFASTLAQDTPASLCVQSFNIYGPAYAPRPETRTKNLVALIPQLPACHIWQIQELWTQSHKKALSQSLAKLGFSSVHFDEWRNENKNEITGISSFFQNGEAYRVQAALFQTNNQIGLGDWVRDRLGVSKGMGAYIYKSPELEDGVLLLNTHTHPSNQLIRIAQLLELVDFYFAQALTLDMPIILTGDLNATPESLEIEILRDVLLLNDSYISANKSYGNACTYCGDNELSLSKDNRVIDYVLYRSSPSREVRVERSEINLQIYQQYPLSDHYGVRSYFSVGPSKRSLLNADSETLDIRVQKSVATLTRAMRALETSSFKELYKRSIDKAKNLQKRFRTEPLDSPLLTYYRLSE